MCARLALRLRLLLASRGNVGSCSTPDHFIHLRISALPHKSRGAIRARAAAGGGYKALDRGAGVTADDRELVAFSAAAILLPLVLGPVGARAFSCA